MWLLIRMLAFIIGCLYKTIGKWRFDEPAGSHAGIPYYERVRSNKRRVTKITVGTDLKCPVLFRLSRETYLDRVFKKLGLSTEIQSGDANFDRIIYVTSDHPLIAKLLERNAELRQLVLNILESSRFCSIYTDGDRLWMETRSHDNIGGQYLEQLMQLRNFLEQVETKISSRFSDPFYRRAFIIESVVMGIAGYALVSYLDYVFNRSDYHLNNTALFEEGIKWAIGMFVVFVAIIVALLRKTSQGHRLITENAFILLLSLPVAGCQLVSDLNRSLDSGEEMIVERQIDQLVVREHRGRRGRRSYTYYMGLAPATKDEAIKVPSTIQIEHGLYSRLSEGQRIEIVVGRGGLDHPWYTAFRAH
jgi:hypothetical protein